MIAKLTRQVLGLTCFLAGLLFLSAGRPHWLGAWLFIGEIGFGSLAVGLSLARHDPALFAERLGRRFEKRQARWDKWLMAGAFLLWGSWFAIMGIEMRLSSRGVSLGCMLLGVLLVACSLLIFHRCLRENTFAVPVNRVQTERNHTVVTTGPYGVVRHPMYAGAILFLIGTPLLLNSFWGLLLVPVMATVFLVRVVLEEQMLVSGLEGYSDYRERVRYRLFPGIW